MHAVDISPPAPEDPCPIKPKRKPSKSIHRGGQLRFDDDVVELWSGRRKELEFKLRLDHLIEDKAERLALMQDLRDLRTIIQSPATPWPINNPEFFLKAVRSINRLLGTRNKNTTPQ